MGFHRVVFNYDLNFPHFELRMRPRECDNLVLMIRIQFSAKISMNFCLNSNLPCNKKSFLPKNFEKSKIRGLGREIFKIASKTRNLDPNNFQLD